MIKKLQRKLITEDSFERLLYLLSFAVIYLSIITRIVSFYYNRSLWLDEGFLASSVVQRNYIELLSPLDYSQGAPIGFLWIVRSFVYLFGSSEYALRLLSLISGITAIFIFYKVLQNVFKDKKPYVGTAFFASIYFLVYYTIEFKPYMFDALITLISIYVFNMAITRKIKTWGLVFYCALVIWFSFPVIFTIATFCLLWFVYSVAKKQKDDIKRSLTTGIITLLSFSAYYLLLYGNLSENQSIAYWDLIRFPMIPESIQDIELVKKIWWHYMSIFDSPEPFIITILSFASLFLIFLQKRRTFILFAVIELLLLLTASYLGYYGMLNRILIFYVPIHAILLTLLITEINLKWKKFGLLVSLGFVLLNIGSFRYLIAKNVYRSMRETNPLINYIERKNESIPVYLYRSSIPTFEYKTGYKGGLSNIPNSPVVKNNTIYGSNYFTFLFEKPYSWKSKIDPDRVILNIDAIKVYPKVYLLFSSCPKKHMKALLEPLKQSGSVEQVYKFKNTPLFLYSKLK